MDPLTPVTGRACVIENCNLDRPRDFRPSSCFESSASFNHTHITRGTHAYDTTRSTALQSTVRRLAGWLASSIQAPPVEPSALQPGGLLLAGQGRRGRVGPPLKPVAQHHGGHHQAYYAGPEQARPEDLLVQEETTQAEGHGHVQGPDHRQDAGVLASQRPLEEALAEPGEEAVAEEERPLEEAGRKRGEANEQHEAQRDETGAEAYPEGGQLDGRGVAELEGDIADGDDEASPDGYGDARPAMLPVEALQRVGGGIQIGNELAHRLAGKAAVRCFLNNKWLALGGASWPLHVDQERRMGDQDDARQARRQSHQLGPAEGLAEQEVAQEAGPDGR